MNLIILEIPDDTAERSRFLEQKIASPDLSQLISELGVVRSAAGIQQEATNRPTLEQYLGNQRQSILERGLSCLSESEVQLLLRHPELMWELQELVLDEGGEYWLALMNQSVTRAPLPDVITSTATRTSTKDASVALGKKEQRPGVRAWGTILGTLAALLLVMVGYQYLSTPAGPTWGFSQPSVFEQSLDGPAYLNHLADAAGAWFNKRPDSKVALTKRLAEFRTGCTQLLAAKHTPLSSADRDWLLERCQKWIDKIDGHLADLQRDEKTFSIILEEADATVKTLQKTLREHTAEVSV